MAVAKKSVATPDTKATVTKVEDTKEVAKAVTPATPVKTESDKKEVPEKKAAVKKETVKKETVKKETVKKEAVKKEAPKKEAAPKAEAKKAPAKKAPAKKAELKSELHIQFGGKSYSEEDLVKIAKDVWQYDLNKKVADLTDVELYVKPEENTVYYVMNKEFTGSFRI